MISSAVVQGAFGQKAVIWITITENHDLSIIRIKCFVVCYPEAICANRRACGGAANHTYAFTSTKHGLTKNHHILQSIQ